MAELIIEESITSSIKTGVGQHTKMLNSIAPSLNMDYQIVSNKLIEKIKNPVLKRIVYLVWLNSIFFFKLLMCKKGTIVLYTSFLPFIKLKNIKQIGVIHDLCIDIFPEKLKKLNHLNLRLVNYLIKKNADGVLAVSDTVKNEIIKYYKIPAGKIYTVYNSFSIDSALVQDEERILKTYGLDFSSKYIISTSSLNPNKNIPCLIEAFEIIKKKFPEYKLVLTGGKKDAVQRCSKTVNNADIIFTISSEDLIGLYKNAVCYVFPSVYEGFGIPLIDAQRLNLPVVCSDIPVFREIGQNSVLYAQLNAESFAQETAKIILSAGLRANLAAAGQENIKRFTKDKILEQFNNLIISL